VAKSAAAPVAVVATALLLLAGAVEVQAIRDRSYPPRDDVGEWLYVESGVAVRRMVGSFAPLASDLYWIRTLQHYGSTKRALARGPFVPGPPPMIADEYPLLYPLLDITTTLDPRFKIAYRFGAVFLAEPHPTGPGRPELAQALLEKGIRAEPGRWEYLQDIGFVHYWYLHDYRAAAEWFRKGSLIAGAPWWLKSLAATTLAQGGDRQSSRRMWEAIRESAEVDWLRQDAERRLAQFQAMDGIDRTQKLVDEFTRQTGAPPVNWSAVARARLIPGIPIDPARVPFELVEGRVQLSRRSPLFPLPEEPKKNGPPPS